MGYVKWIIIGLVVVVLGSVLQYSLPKHAIVRVVGVEVRLETLGLNRFFFAETASGMEEGEARDVRYIETFRSNGRELVFRNEDTGWGWPPFFKFDAADLHARARNLISTEADPQWVAVRYYGFRSVIFSIYPNALDIRPVDGPDARIVPWTRMIVFTAFFGFIAWLWLALRRFREQRVEPFLEEVEQRRDAARGVVGRTFDRLIGRRRHDGSR